MTECLDDVKVGVGTGPHLLRDSRGYVWARQSDGRFVMEGDSSKFARTLAELCSTQFAAVIGEVEEISAESPHSAK